MTKDERIDQLSIRVMELEEQLKLAQVRAADSEDRAQNLKRQSRYAIDNWQSEAARLAKDYDKERRAREAAEQERDALAARVERLERAVEEAEKSEARHWWCLGMANARRFAKSKKAWSNAKLFMELFGTGMSTAHERCREIALDPDANETPLEYLRLIDEAGE